MKIRVYVKSVPGMKEEYSEHVDIQMRPCDLSEPKKIKQAAVRKLHVEKEANALYVDRWEPV